MKWLKSGIILVVFLSSSWAAPVPFADEDDPLRLPKTSVPLSYDIILTTNVHDEGDRVFSGIVFIDIEILDETEKITLHNRGLKIDGIKLSEKDGDEIIGATYGLESDKDFMHITSLSPLSIGRQYTIEISYNSLLDTGTNGFYRSSYRADGDTRYSIYLIFSLLQRFN